VMDQRVDQRPRGRARRRVDDHAGGLSTTMRSASSQTTESAIASGPMWLSSGDPARPRPERPRSRGQKGRWRPVRPQSRPHRRGAGLGASGTGCRLARRAPAPYQGGAAGRPRSRSEGVRPWTRLPRTLPSRPGCGRSSAS
jgi:hypothetical protein